MGLLKIFRKQRTSTEGPKYVLHFETEREEDGRYLVEITDLPGVMAYGETQDEAINRAASLALRVIADRIDNGEAPVRRRLDLVLEPA